MHFFVVGTKSWVEGRGYGLAKQKKIYGIMGLEILLLQSYDRFVQTEAIQYVPWTFPLYHFYVLMNSFEFLACFRSL